MNSRTTPTLTKGKLILADGTTIEGNSFGSETSSSGEVIFNTGMVGYPESLTDPSYSGQILVLTYPMIGNYGIPKTLKYQGLNTRFESNHVHIAGLIVAQYSYNFSHWQAEQSLSEWLKKHKIPALSGVDTRALTKILPTKGTMLGKIIFNNDDNQIPFYDPSKENLCAKVSSTEPMIYGSGKHRVLLIDCGCKENIVHHLLKMGVEVLSVPYNHDISKENFDAVLISNGPGNPANYPQTVKMISYAIENKIPTFGICLGHQLMSIAIGAKTYRLKYGHHSQNQPVKEVFTNRCYITSQNHGYAVEPKTLPDGWQPWFVNLNDGTNEGIRHKSGLFMSVQFHPEAAPGPVDSGILFNQFKNCIFNSKSNYQKMKKPTCENPESK